MEQLSLGMDKTDERLAFEMVYPELADLIHNAPLDSRILIFREIKDRSSVYFLSQSTVYFQVSFRKKTKFLFLPETYADELPTGTQISQVKSDGGMIRVELKTPKDILRYISPLRNILDGLIRSYHFFGCCSRYEACSDAKQCIHPDALLALGCKYRQNLMDGKIFYGKNRNID